MEENVNKIIENGEEVMEVMNLENAQPNSSQKTLMMAGMMGIGISVGIIAHRYIIEPAFSKIKSKLEQRKAAKDEPELDESGDDENGKLK